MLRPLAAGDQALAASRQEPALAACANPAEAQLLSELDALNRLLTRAARN
jgi:hypothetical protein